MTKPKNPRHGNTVNQLRALREPTRADYEKMVQACLEALISDQNAVLVACSYLVKLPEDFPHARIVGKEGVVDIRRILARPLLQWLYDHGYTDITPKAMSIQKGTFTRFIDGIGNFSDFDENHVDSESLDGNNDIHQLLDDEEDSG